MGDLDGVGVVLGDLLDDGGREWVALGLRVGAADLVGLPVACGDLVGVDGTHAPHVDAMYPGLQIPEMNGSHDVYPRGHGVVGASVLAGVEATDTPFDAVGDAAIMVGDGLLDAHSVGAPDPAADGVGLGSKTGHTGCARTIRLVPCSSQEAPTGGTADHSTPDTNVARVVSG